jgi:AcrR family transcriptional regulator
MKRRAHLGRPPGATRKATTARIVAAARSCFARTGYAATTNHDIARRAGVSTAAIYQYFASKTELYLAAVRDANEEIVPHYRRALAEATSLRGGLRAVLTASARLHALDPSLTAFLSALPVEMQRHAELKRAIEGGPSEIVALFAEIVDGGVERGEIPAALAPRLVLTFVACAMGMSLFAAAIDGSQLEAITETFGDLLDGNLFAAPKSRKRR